VTDQGSPRTLVFADVHLVRQTPREVSEDLARLISDHPGSRIIVAGDLFDLASERPKLPLPLALETVMGAHPALREALARHVDRGSDLWLTSGNHDEEVGSDGFHEAFLGALGASPGGRLHVRTTPWFFQEGALHIEHGHLYDPDNAVAHPLVIGERSLGTLFTQEFIATTGAHRYLNANDSTPLKLFLSSFTWYGPRAPYVIYRYFYTAIMAMLKSGPFYNGDAEVPLGRERARALAEELGIPQALLEEMAAQGATPTMKSLSQTFSRLYFDRVLATLVMSGGLGALLTGRRAGAAALALGALLMGTSWAKGHNRYAGSVAERLAQGASRVAGVTGAKLVVFGHTHREAQSEGYANTGSFAFPRDAPGRPFLEIEGTAAEPRAVRRYIKPNAG
jgi:UDP-2,3-diacylglucosamine pyrophosphatase LpxH